MHNNHVKDFDQFVNESIMSKAKSFIDKTKKAVKDYREERKNKQQEENNLETWKRWEEAIVDFTIDAFDIDSATYGSSPEVISTDPLTFKFSLSTYKDGARAGRRTFTYAMPESDDADVTDGRLEEVTSAHT